MSSFPKFKELCSPAAFYFVVSFIAWAVVVAMNLRNHDFVRMGAFIMKVPSTMIFFICKLVCILFWTWVLNLICKSGHKYISWILVLVPWILILITMSLIMCQ